MFVNDFTPKGWLQNLTTAAQILTFLNLAVVWYFVSRFRRISLVHPNLRIIMICMVCSAVIISLTKTLSELLQHYLSPSLSAAFCKYAANPINCLCMGCTQITFFCFFVERYFATCNPAGYENRDATFAKMVVAALLIVGITFAVAIITIDKTTAEVYPIVPQQCLSLSRRPAFVILNWIIILIFTVPVAIALIFVYRYNALQIRHPERGGGLSARYQYNENAAVLSAMMPAFLGCSTVFGALGYLAGGYVVWLMGMRAPVSEKMLIALKTMEMDVDLSATFYQLIFMWLLPAMRQAIGRDFGWIFHMKVEPRELIVRPDAHGEADIYFRGLAASWQ